MRGLIILAIGLVLGYYYAHHPGLLHSLAHLRPQDWLWNFPEKALAK